MDERIRVAGGFSVAFGRGGRDISHCNRVGKREPLPGPFVQAARTPDADGVGFEIGIVGLLLTAGVA